MNIVKYLVRKGAKINIKDDLGVSTCGYFAEAMLCWTPLKVVPPVLK